MDATLVQPTLSATLDRCRALGGECKKLGDDHYDERKPYGATVYEAIVEAETLIDEAAGHLVVAMRRADQPVRLVSAPAATADYDRWARPFFGFARVAA